MGHCNEVVDDVIITRPKKGSEEFTGSQASGLASATLRDFWRWAYSDIVVNTNRGCLAEFIVSKVLGTPEYVKKGEWESYDLETKEGLRIEVKSSAYQQSWKQQKRHAPRFSIRKSKEWRPKTNDYAEKKSRNSHVYVFCLLKYRDGKECLNPLDLGQWEFYVVATHRIDDRFGDREEIGLTGLRELSEPHTVDGLADAVREASEHSR